MSWTPITGSALQHMADSVAANNYYIKFYASGTTTPISMATDSTGGTLLAKAQFNDQGYAINGSSAVFIPHIDQKYKVLFYPNATDADANTFANAIYNIDAVEQFATQATGAENVKNFATLAAAVADTGLVDGDALNIAERTTGNGGGAMWDVVLSSTVTENTYNIVQCTGVATLSLVLRDDGVAHLNRWGMLGDDSTDNRLIYQALQDYATTNLLKITGDSGTYQFTKATVGVQGEAVALAYPCATMSSNLYIDMPDGVVFKVADSQSSDVSDFNVPILFSIEILTNITIRGLTFDSNYTNNPVNTVAHTWAQVGFSGSPTASTMAMATDVLIENCVFKNNPGVNCILMSQSENTAGTVGKRWTVKNNLFIDNGYKTYDHSSIYGYADDVLIEGNTFDNFDMFGTTQIGGTDVGGQVAYEVHGANTRFINNKVKNYDQGMWIATNKITDADNIIIQGNTFSPIRDTGIGFFRETAPESLITKVLIEGNTFGLTDDSTAVSLKAAIVCTATYTISNVRIAENICSKVGTSESSAFLNIGPQSVASQKHTDIVVENNYALGTCFGVYGFTNATNGLGNITIRNNDWINLDDTAAFGEVAGIAMNVSGSNTIDTLTIDGNSCINTTGDCDRGIYLEKGTITDLYLGTNPAKGMTNDEYTEGASLTITNRHGTYPTVNMTPVWKSGGTGITIGNGSENAYWTKVGELVYFHARLIVGSTTTFPGGTITHDLPITAATANIKYLGECLLIDGGTRLMHQVVIDGTGTTATLNQNGGTFITDTSPSTLTTGDEIFFSVVYRVAD